MTQTLNGTAGSDTLTGTDVGAPANPDGIDIINGLAGNDTLSGVGGNDVIQGGTGADAMNGGAGIDTLTYANATSGIQVALNGFAQSGDAQGDTMSGFENLIGSSFNDQLAGDNGKNAISGGGGNDYIQLSAGGDTLDGGAGSADILDGRVWGAALTVNLAAGTLTGTGTGGATLLNLEWVLGTGFNDIQTANQSVNTILAGGGGNDILNGLDANDQLYGDNFFEIGGTGTDTLNGGNGNDYLEGGKLGDALNGGAGTDTAGYADSDAAVTVNLATGSASGGHAAVDTFNSIESLTGSKFADVLTGSAGANALSGGSGNDLLDGAAGADTLNGGAGVDTATYAASAAAVSINLLTNVNTGGFAQGDALNSIENIVGSKFADTLVGSAAANVLDGGNGNDTLQGRSGADTLQGGNGTDTASYAGSAAGVNLSLTSNTASGGDAQGDSFSSIENIIGSAFADVINGQAGANVLDGGDGDDILAGRGGADILQGGNGSDTANYIASAAVTVNLATNTATGGDAAGDTFSSIENVSGSNSADSLTGNAGANRLDGVGGDDLLNGGAGADALIGGAGIDTADYAASATGVTINLATGSGTGGDAEGDSLIGIENVMGSGLSDRLTGDSLANTLTAAGGDDILDGGAGGDTLLGGNGNDTASYRGSGAAVVVDLMSGIGTGADAQGDTLTGIENLTGSQFSDSLAGDNGANILHDGGAGSDTLTGNGGDDTYIAYDAAAVIVEIAGEGHDRLASGVDFVLAAGISVEYLNTTSLSATSAIDLTGNEIGQWVRGNDGANVLDGGGGIDTLFGMGGTDVFRFSTALGARNVGRIADFSVTDDQIHLDDAIFTALSVGVLDASAFKDIALGPRDADDRILYNSDTGSLFYDADGSGGAFTPIKFATVTPGLPLSAADFVVV